MPPVLLSRVRLSVRLSHAVYSVITAYCHNSFTDRPHSGFSELNDVRKSH